LILFAVGDEAGEQGDLFAGNLKQWGYVPSAIAHIVNVAQSSHRGETVRRAAEVLGVPYTEVNVEQFTERLFRCSARSKPFSKRSRTAKKAR